MTKLPPGSRRSKWQLLTLAAAFPFLLSLAQCASSPPPPALGASCGSVTCTSTSNCTSVANWPLCAKTGSAVCHATYGECTYQLKNDPACPCLERDVRLCNVNATTPGVQICTANAGRTATFWGTCTACANCT